MGPYYNKLIWNDVVSRSGRMGTNHPLHDGGETRDVMLLQFLCTSHYLICIDIYQSRGNYRTQKIFEQATVRCLCRAELILQRLGQALK